MKPEQREALAREWKGRALTDHPVMTGSFRVARLDDLGQPIGRPIVTGGEMYLEHYYRPILGGKEQSARVVTVDPFTLKVRLDAHLFTEHLNSLVGALQPVATAIGSAFNDLAAAWQKSMVKGMAHPMLALEAPDRPPRAPERPCSVCGGRTVRRPRWSPRGKIAAWDERCQRCARLGYWPEVLEVSPVALKENLATMTGEGYGWGQAEPT